METIENASGCPAIDELIASSKTLDNGESTQEDYHLKWIPYSEFTDIESIEHSTSKQLTHYATYEQAKQYNYDGDLISQSKCYYLEL